MSIDTAERYTIISSDCHAGADHATYRDYLDTRWHDDFDAWRGEYTNPFKDLQEADKGKRRNWDDELRVSEQNADGIVAEITFPNTVPPFFPTGTLIAYPPKERADYERRRAGVQAHNRWLADWCGRFPARRRGVAQIFLNDVDETVADIRTAHRLGLRSILLPSVPPDQGIPALFEDCYRPVWAVCQELGMVVTAHAGNGAPDYAEHDSAGMIFIQEVPFFSNRTLWHLILSGVFEQFPGLKLVMTEQGVGWVPDTLRRLDGLYMQGKATGRIGELGFPSDDRLAMKPSEYFDRNVWIGASFPGPREAAAIRKIGAHKAMWGSDYPHHEGTPPYSREALRLSFHDWDEADLRKILSENAALVYGFDLDVLDPLGAEFGPTVDEVKVPLDAKPERATSPAFF
ncbi:MAG: amidohydrolase [Acidimicrobiia bacterium]|nr:amidohydrolase [Acidimicrobiia bacterium]